MVFSAQPFSKQFNKNKILQFIFRNGPISRATIAESTNMTPATVTLNVATLISQGIIEDIGEVESKDETSLGRKRVLVDFCAHYAFSIGCEITEKLFSFCIIDLKGNIHAQTSFIPTHTQIQSINQVIIDNIEQLIHTSPIERIKFIGLGIALPGHYDKQNDTLVTNSPIWKNFSVGLLKEHFPFDIVCENNVRCMACNEYFFNKQEAPESFTFFHLGRGIFCANIINGELFIGNNFFAGEVGHTTVHTAGPLCECGKHGCLQTYCSETWLIQKCQLLYENVSSTTLRELVPSSQEITIREISLAYQLGEPLIHNMIAEMIKYLSITISNIMIISNPSKILFHSELFTNEQMKQQLLSSIKYHLDFIDNDLSDTFQVIPYSYSKGSVGAAALAINHFLMHLS